MLLRHCQQILAKQPANRMLALDALRGLAILAMILVNNPGSWQYVYPPLLHAEWHGWTPTFVLLSSGFTALVLGLFLWLTEMKRYRLWAAPLLVFGVNAILFFMLAGVAARVLSMVPVAGTTLGNWLYRSAFQPLFGDYNGSLAYAICFLLLSYIGMLYCYRRGWIFKV